LENEEAINKDKLSRRTFIHNTSLALAGSIAGILTRKAAGQGKASEPAQTPKILNYNPLMGYRRLGKTGLMVSEVSLGGHWKNRAGERYWDEFTDEQVPSDVAKNRIEVISACIDAGINYLDIGTSAECLAYGVALKGRRDKMIIGADDYKLCAREPKRCTVEKLTFDIDSCLRHLRMDYLDIWRVKADMYGDSTDAHVETMIETFQRAHQAGKVRYFGISSHRRPWLQHVIETFAAVQVVSFPVTAKTKEKGRLPSKDSVEEVEAGYGADTEQSIFQSVRKHNVGLIAIKPFMGGNLFKLKTRFPVPEPGDKQEHDLARLTLQCILTNEAVTATIPGLSTIHEVDNAVKASYASRAAMAPAERHWLEQMTERSWAALPKRYVWLHDWETV
jgi:aryl-alcohol dehydrogenase-like predicted oxidoreductase